METKDILLLVAGAAIGLIVNYFTHFTSDPLAKTFREWQERRAQDRAIQSVEKAKKRIALIEHEIAVVKWFIQNPVLFNALGFNALQELIMNLTLIVILGFAVLLVELTENTRLLIGIAFILIWMFRTSRLDSHNNAHRIFRKVVNFHSYEAQTHQQLDELRAVVNQKE